VRLQKRIGVTKENRRAAIDARKFNEAQEKQGWITIEGAQTRSNALPHEHARYDDFRARITPFSPETEGWICSILMRLNNLNAAPDHHRKIQPVSKPYRRAASATSMHFARWIIEGWRLLCNYRKTS